MSDRGAESVAGSISQRVAAVMRRAEQDAARTKADAETYAEESRKAAADESANLLRESARKLELEAGRRIDAIVELRQAIAKRSAELAEIVEDPSTLRRGVVILLETLAEAADLIAHEVSMATGGRPLTTADAAQPADEPPPPLADGESTAAEEAGETVAPDTSAQPSPRGKFPRRYAEARLRALTLAIDGAGREELEPELRSALDANETGTILDEVLGQFSRRRRKRERSGSSSPARAK